MTVAAVIFAESAAAALLPADGLARVRRIADTAWSGGALPIVVVTADRTDQLLAALAGASATVVDPERDGDDPDVSVQSGIEAAVALVSGTTGVLVWPAAMCWVGPETVTSLIEAHGARPDALLEPTFRGRPGWPKLLPLGQSGVAAALTLRVDQPLDGSSLTGLFVAAAALELGDPGVIIDGDTDRAALPPYDGPAGPAHNDHHEWGDSIDELTGEPTS